jgi:glycosyltransferase involved in cell wall biosynthesis
MRISLISPYFPPEINGIAISVFYRARILRSMGYQVQLIIPDYGSDNEYTRSVRDSGILTNLISTRPFRATRTNLFPTWIRSGHEIGSSVLSFDPEIAIVDDPYMFLLLSGYIPIKKILSQSQKISVGICHANVPLTLRKFRKPFFAKIAEFVIPKVHNRFSMTVFASTYLRQAYPRIRNGYVAKFLGVDKDRFGYSQRTFEKDNVNILYVGRVEPDKDIEFLYDVAMEYRPDQRKVTWHFVGDGTRLSMWRERQTDDVKFHGFVEPAEITSWYANADIFVSACEFEAFGLSIVEAMTMGLPVLVPNTGAASSHFVDGESGFTYTPGDKASFISRLDRLVFDAALRRRVGLVASSTTISWADATKNLIETVIEAANGR